jgi:hypothetical protein
MSEFDFEKWLDKQWPEMPVDSTLWDLREQAREVAREFRPLIEAARALSATYGDGTAWAIDEIDEDMLRLNVALRDLGVLP